MGVGATALAAGSLAVAVVGAGVSAYGAYSSGQAQGKEADYQAQVASNNALIAKNNANLASQTGQVQAENQGLKNAQVGGAIKAAQAAGNVDVNSGSNVDVQKSERQVGELDAQTIRSNAALQAYGFQTQSTSAAAQGGLFRYAASQAPIAGDIGAAGSLLGGASSAGSKYASFLQTSGGSPGLAPGGVDYGGI